MTLQDKKDLVLQLLLVHPSIDWYRQCIDIYMTDAEVTALQEDTRFLSEVQSTLFAVKQELMKKRTKAIEVAAKRGNWQGYDKLLQEVDSQLFSINKDIGSAVRKPSTVVYIPDNGRA